jgi:hypothetical protein
MALLRGSKNTRMSLPKQEELSLRAVLAFPYASITGLACMICRSREARHGAAPVPAPGAAPAPAAAGAPLPAPPRPELELALLALSSATNFRTCFVASVLPAPDSPEMMTDCGTWSLTQQWYVRLPTLGGGWWKQVGEADVALSLGEYAACMTSAG